LIESNQKKATFLREVIRTLSLDCATVFCGRAENFSQQANFVSLRAVERFESSISIAAEMVEPQGSLALLIGQAQATRAREVVANFRWHEPVPVPMASKRILLIGSNSVTMNQTG
jgi:16S rRNA (guanine527-N7)-methyltransferase